MKLKFLIVFFAASITTANAQAINLQLQNTYMLGTGAAASASINSGVSNYQDARRRALKRFKAR